MSLKKIDGTGKFTVINFEITNTCNKNCKYCAKMYKKNRKITHMAIKDYKYIVSCMDKRDRKKFRKIIITGGEPLLNPNVLDIILLMRKDFPKAELALYSNGKLLKKLPHKNLRILPNIKNFIVSISDYKGWNDNVKEKYDNHYKLPNIWKRLINKFTIRNKFMEYINLDYRFPIITKKIRRFLLDPLKRGNVYFTDFIGFYNLYDDPNLSEETAKKVRDSCWYHMLILGKKLYNCCLAESPERYYNTDSVSVDFDKNWKSNYFKLPTWKACAHCRVGTNQYRFTKIESKIGHKKYINMEARKKIGNPKGHE